nr:MFS transporter [Nannocystis pusilla]
MGPARPRWRSGRVEATPAVGSRATLGSPREAELRRARGRRGRYTPRRVSTVSPRIPTPSLGVLAAISVCHGMNDLMQSVLPAVYPLLKDAYRLDFGQIGLITFANQATASLLQPLIGAFTDRRPQPFSLPIGMAFTLVGLLLLSVAPAYATILLAVALVGIGSSVFHPESSRVARLASGGRHGFAQSLFQVGGNVGSSTGPLLAAYIVLPYGQQSIAWFGVTALAAMTILIGVGKWYRGQIADHLKTRANVVGALPRGKVRTALIVLVLLVFSKNIYLASLSSYYTFYLIDKSGSRSRARRFTCLCCWRRSRPAPSSAAPSAIASVAST